MKYLITLAIFLVSLYVIDNKEGRLDQIIKESDDVATIIKKDCLQNAQDEFEKNICNEL